MTNDWYTRFLDFRNGGVDNHTAATLTLCHLLDQLNDLIHLAFYDKIKSNSETEPSKEATVEAAVTTQVTLDGQPVPTAAATDQSAVDEIKKRYLS